jgi:hypothetical protein
MIDLNLTAHHDGQVLANSPTLAPLIKMTELLVPSNESAWEPHGVKSDLNNRLYRLEDNCAVSLRQSSIGPQKILRVSAVRV